MELEQRVKTLEYEIKVLKSEIQRTLLDIQEQILLHYYPALRAEESETPESARQTIQALHAAGNGKPASAQAPGSLERDAPAHESEAPTDTPTPVIRKVSVDQARAAHGEPAPAEEMGRMGKLLEWSLNGAAQIGLEPIKALIRQLAARKIITPDVQDVLLHIAPLNRRAPPETVGVREAIQVIMQFDAILGRAADIEEALALIEEAKIG